MTDICRLCLLETCNTSTNNDDVPNETKIKAIIPEIDLYMTSSVTVCNLCSQLLSVAYEFKLGCLKMEENFKQYLRECGLSVPLDLKAYKNSTLEDSTQIKREITEEVDNADVEKVYNVDTMIYKNLKMEDVTQIKCEMIEEGAESVEANIELQFIKGRDFSAPDLMTYKNPSMENLTQIKSEIIEDSSMENVEVDNLYNIKEELIKQYDLNLHLDLTCPNLTSQSKCEVKVEIDDSAGTANLNDIQEEFDVHITCDKCGSVFHDNDNYNIHEENCTLYKCSKCDKEFSSKEQLRDHFVQHMPSQSYECRHCNTFFAAALDLKIHLQDKHSSLPSFICDICNQHYTHKSSFRRHKLTHTSQKSYICPICDKKMSRKYLLERHMELHSNESYACQICGKSVPGELMLKKHMSTTHSRSTTCEICGIKLCSIGALIDHVRIHSGEKPFQCEICGRKFTQSSSLRSHKMHIHVPTSTGVRCKGPYVCDNCGKTFRSKNNFESHMSLHRPKDAVKTVPCMFENCEKKFYNDRNRNQHIVKCHRERKASCNVCGKTFVDNYSLRKHMRVHTGKRS